MNIVDDNILIIFFISLFCHIFTHPGGPRQILALIEEISLALKDEFKVYLSELMPHFLAILHTDRTDGRRPTLKVLHALETFGLNLDDYLYLVIPPLMRCVCLERIFV